MSILKTIISSQILIANNVLTADKVGGIENNNKLIKKSGKSSKSGKSKSEKLFIFQKLAKSGKKLSKSGNLLKFDATEAGSSFLTSKARAAFNYLQLTFTKTPIF